MKMFAKLAVAFAAMCLFLPCAAAQSDNASQPTVYTYVSWFAIPRANWQRYAQNTERTFVPVADKMVANGTILSYSTFENVVHTPDGYTHGSAWSATSISGLMKVLDELRKNPPDELQNTATRHEDYIMQTSMYAMGEGGQKPAYLRVVCQNAKTDKPGDYRNAIRKFIWPIASDALKKGDLAYIGLDSQYVNTQAPSTSCLVISYPNAEGMDHWADTVKSNFDKMSPEDRQEFYGGTVPDSRRDLLMRVTHSGQKK